MRYILDPRYRFRGWYKLPGGIFDTVTKSARFPAKEVFLLLLKCDGIREIDPESLSPEERDSLRRFEEQGVIHPAVFGQFLRPEQLYKTYPARYREEVHWSVTGACNLKCRHCFMSAPQARHGTPSREELLRVIDQLAECGIFRVGITGGEPLIRGDLFDLIDALNEREIGIDVLYTNGWLVDEAFLDRLEEHHVRTGFQLSLDGPGSHDWLRGLPGAEERTVRALKLLQERGYPVSVSLCVNRHNMDRLRESVNLMASLGVRSMKCGSMMDLGEWIQPEVAEAVLTPEEELAAFERYIPLYFEDDAPLSIMLGGAFMYTPGNPEWQIWFERRISAEEEVKVPSCGVLSRNFYIGAEGMVAPCMGMADCGYAEHFPNLNRTPLKDILRDSEFVDLCYTTVGDIRERNPKCRECAYVDRCTGGCRNAVLTHSDDYYAVDPDVCRFFENGWDKRIRAAAEKPFAEYLLRHPPEKREGQEKKEETDPRFC